MRRLQLLDRAPRARARQRADGARARRSRSSASARRATTSFAASSTTQIIELIDLRAVRTHRLRQRRDDRQKVIGAVRGGRVRRRDAVLLALQVGDRADPDRAAAHPGGDPAGRAATAARRRLRIRARRGARSWPTCCRATSRCRSSGALLENAASEQGARMSAMDNATRNAGDMIKQADAELQPHAPGDDHQGTDRDHLGRRGALSTIQRGPTPWPAATRQASPPAASPR